VVQDDNGNWMEPSVYDIDDTELSRSQIVGNWACMGVAIGLMIFLAPFFGVCLYGLTRGK
jgi:hypothetical protein